MDALHKLIGQHLLKWKTTVNKTSVTIGNLLWDRHIIEERKIKYNSKRKEKMNEVVVKRKQQSM